MISLDLDNAIANGASRAAFSLEVSGQFRKFVRSCRHAGDHRHSLSLSSLRLPSNAHDSVVRSAGAGIAPAFGQRPAACGTHSPMLGRIDDSSGFQTCRFFHTIDLLFLQSTVSPRAAIDVAYRHRLAMDNLVLRAGNSIYLRA
jgi:hypothetical protein